MKVIGLVAYVLITVGVVLYTTGQLMFYFSIWDGVTYHQNSRDVVN